MAIEKLGRRADKENCENSENTPTPATPKAVRFLVGGIGASRKTAEGVIEPLRGEVN